MPLDRHISVFAEPAFEPRNVLSLRGEATSRRPRISRQASTRQVLVYTIIGALATALIIRLCPSQHLCGNQPVCRMLWLRRAVKIRHRHAIEQVSRRWREGRRVDSGRKRRKFDFHTLRHVIIKTPPLEK